MPPAKPRPSEQQVRDLFYLPLKEAAEKLNICPSVLKKCCREYNIKRWPFRKLQKLKKMNENLALQQSQQCMEGLQILPSTSTATNIAINSKGRSYASTTTTFGGVIRHNNKPHSPIKPQARLSPKTHTASAFEVITPQSSIRRTSFVDTISHTVTPIAPVVLYNNVIVTPQQQYQRDNAAQIQIKEEEPFNAPSEACCPPISNTLPVMHGWDEEEYAEDSNSALPREVPRLPAIRELFGDLIFKNSQV